MRRFAVRRGRRAQAANGPRCGVAVALAALASFVWFQLPVAALTTAVGPPERGPASWSLPWLHAGDRRILDSSGRTVLLHGFDTSVLLEPTVLRAPLDDADATMMEGDGFDVVRLAVSWGRLEPVRGRWDSGYLQAISDTVRMLNRHHLYVVIDMHFLDWSSALGGSGAPSWAVLPALPNPHIAALGDWQRHLSPAVIGATTYFWLSPDWQADFFAAWQHVAARLRDDSGVAGYDIYNEPHAVPLPPVRFERDFLWPLYAHAIDAIARVDTNHLFIVEGQLLGDAGTDIVPLHAPGLVYSPHEYTGSLVPPAFTGDASSLDEHVAAVAAEGARVPAPVWVGEWGIGAGQAHALAWVDAATSAFDAAGAGWAWWQWREDSPWGVRDSAGHIDTALLTHLARPYLAAAPPGVAAFGADGVHGALRVVFAPAYGGQTAEVAWPALTTAAPSITGTCAYSAVWVAGTARLALAAPPGAACTLDISAGV